MAVWVMNLRRPHEAERSSLLERVDNYSLLALSQLVSQKSEDPIIALYGHVQETRLLRLKFTIRWPGFFPTCLLFAIPPLSPHYKLVCKDALSLSYIMSCILNCGLKEHGFWLMTWFCVEFTFRSLSTMRFRYQPRWDLVWWSSTHTSLPDSIPDPVITWRYVLT